MLANFLLWQDAPNSYLAQLPASLREAIQKRLTMFVMRAKVKVSDASDAWVRLGVGGLVQEAKLTNRVRPDYPALARQARIQGTVRFQTLIGTDGQVKGLSLVSGHPLLMAAAQDAIQQWVYQPTLLNGNPVEVVTLVDINFTLAP